MKNFLGKVFKIGTPVAFLLPAFVFAQVSTPPTVLSGGIGSVASTLCVIFNWMFYFLVILAIIFVVVAAFRYLFAAGDPAKVKSAGHALIYAAVAIAVGLLAKSVPGIVSTLMGGSNIVGC
jgi:uncharacterized membrane protein